MPTLTPKSISQAKLARFAELKQAAEELEILRKEIVALAEQGLPCQPGRYVLKATQVAGQCRPAWKEEAHRLAGQLQLDIGAWEQQIISNTVPTKSYLRIEVLDRDNPVT